MLYQNTVQAPGVKKVYTCTKACGQAYAASHPPSVFIDRQQQRRAAASGAYMIWGCILVSPLLVCLSHLV